MTTDSDNLENELRGIPRAQADPSFKNELLDAILSEPSAARRAIPIPLWLAAAAALLLICGLWAMASRDNRAAVPAPLAPLASAADDCEILRCLPESEAVLVKQYSDFSMNRVEVGGALAGGELKQVETDAVYMEGGKRSGKTAVVDWNRDAGAMLAREVSGLSARYAAGAMSGEQLSRLEAIAYAGNPEALTLLRDIAADTGAAKDEALNETRQRMRQITLTAALARSGAKSARMEAIKALGRTNSPLAVDALRDLAATLPDDDAALQCVTQLAGRDAAVALPTLRALAETAASEAVRADAAARAATLLESESK